MTVQKVYAGTPFRDQLYSAVALNWLQIRPQPERWLGTVAAYIPEAHNKLVQAFLETDGDRLLILEDDHIVQPNIIARCRGHRADAVTGLYVQRRPPFSPVLYSHVTETGVAVDMQPDSVSRLIDQGHRGITNEVPIEGTGTGVLSVHRRVFETLKYPWFEASPYATHQGDAGGHDLWFCQKLRAAGFSLAWDTSEHMRCIHIGWDTYDIDRWIERLLKNRDGNVVTPQAV